MWAVNPSTYCDDEYSSLTHLCNCYFAVCFIRVWNLVCHIKERTCTEGLQERVLREVFGPAKEEVFIHSFILWAHQLMPRMHLSLGLIVQSLSVRSAQIQQPCAFYVEAKVSYWGCAYFFWFNKQIPKNVVALMSQRLAAANNMLHCFGLLPAESARWIPIKQDHSIQVPS
jgi:hypothetical protein